MAGIGLVWTGYKAMGQATGGTWPLTGLSLPVPTDDRTLPAFLDILVRFAQPQRLGDEVMLWRYLLDGALFTFRSAAVGFAAGLVIGLGLSLAMLRSGWLERGLLPYVIASQTVPLIALAPLVVAWGNQLDHAVFFTWRPWMSVSIIATYLTFFPVSVNALRGLKSPAADSLELMRSYASSWRQTLLKLRLPAAVPYLIPALKVSATSAVVGAIVGEISAGVRGGLGRLIIDYSQQYLTDPARLYCAVIAAGLLGVAFVALIGALDAAVMRSRPRSAS
ncbi:MAG TPA: ABC transporter permease subunit [Egibacteraceae bacterium]|nr:ABC transporter permease subunit [Egibacteraceae bacterium]